jgi:galactokinase
MSSNNQMNGIIDANGDEWDLSFTTPGRVCLFGDKTDLADLPVMAATISLGVTIKARKLPNNVIKMSSASCEQGLCYKVGEKGDYTHRLKYWCAVAYLLRDRIEGFEAMLETTLPMGKGMASSGAISVAITKALNKLFNLNMDKNEVALGIIFLPFILHTHPVAYNAEHFELGIPCGRMDQWSISHTGVCWMETCPNPKVKQLNTPPEFAIVVGDTTEPRPLIKVLPIYKKRLADKDEVFHFRHLYLFL